MRRRVEYSSLLINRMVVECLPLLGARKGDVVGPWQGCGRGHEIWRVLFARGELMVDVAGTVALQARKR